MKPKSITFGPLPPGIPANLTGLSDKRPARLYVKAVYYIDDFGDDVLEEAASLLASNRINPGDL